MIPRFVVAALSLGAGLAIALPAQNLTAFPSEYQSSLGTQPETYFPYGHGVSRAQAVLERQALNIPNGRQISQIRLRQMPNYGGSVGRMLQLSVYMGGTDKTAANCTGDFLGNYSNGTPRTLVFGPAIFSLPAMTATSAPWDQPALTLTTPYTYNANENLVLEFVVTANNNANQAFTYYTQGGYFISPATNFGQGCLTSANQTPALTGQGGYTGYQVGFSLQQAPANSTLYFHMNVVPSTPIDGGPFGAPGCTLLVNPLAAVLATAPSGYFSYGVPVPNDPSFYGLSIYGQAIIFDLFANALGFAASNGVQVEIGRLPPMAKILSQGNATATTGSVTRNSGPIFVFQHN